MSVQIRWSGADDGAVSAAVEAGLRDGAELLLEEANRKAPIETGDLIRSGSTAVEGDEAAVGYSSIYAARQHEELGYQHDAGREAKWLENALTNNKARIAEAIAAKIRSGLSG